MIEPSFGARVHEYCGTGDLRSDISSLPIPWSSSSACTEHLLSDDVLESRTTVAHPRPVISPGATVVVTWPPCPFAPRKRIRLLEPGLTHPTLQVKPSSMGSPAFASGIGCAKPRNAPRERARATSGLFRCPDGNAVRGS